MAGRRTGHRTPRWVWVSLIAGAVVVLVLVAALIAGGGSHGPDRHGLDRPGAHRHAPAGVPGDPAPPPAGGYR